MKSLYLAIPILLFIGFLTYGYQASAPLAGIAQGVLPNSALTPGALNPDITQVNIKDTICNPNWSTKSIRPPSSYTTVLKKKQIVQYKYPDVSTADYEEDHLISLELGGSPTDPKNLWPESYKTTPNAKDKDKVENYLHSRVCSGTMTLANAQAAIAHNWTAVYATMSEQFGGASGVSNIDNDDE